MLPNTTQLQKGAQLLSVTDSIIYFYPNYYLTHAKLKIFHLPRPANARHGFLYYDMIGVYSIDIYL